MMHTKGPRKTFRHYVPGGIMYRILRDCHGANDPTTATVSFEANARLIAEAPSLKEENTVLRNTISLLKGENERLTEYIEDYEDDARKVLADECAPDEKHCACVPALRNRVANLLEALEAFVWAQDASDRNTGPRWNIQFLDEANTKALKAIVEAKHQ